MLLEKWKESIIVHIYKKGEKTNCTNYRGISLLLTSYNFFQYYIVILNDIIGDHQCGFGRNRSTADQIFCMREI